MMEICLFVVGVICGFVSNLITNGISSRRHAKAAEAALAKQYSGIVGEYIAFPVDGNEINFQDPIRDCRIDHLGGHVLKLRYKEKKNDHIWEAEIWMVSPFTGSMVFRYIRLFGQEPALSNNFGFKRCAVFERPGHDGAIRTFFCLYGEGDYGKEALEKKIIQTVPLPKNRIVELPAPFSFLPQKKGVLPANACARAGRFRRR
jgi:hypothetical protein